MKKTLPAFTCFLLFTMALSAADVTGKWIGSFTRTGPEGDTKEATAFMNLKQSGTEVTGTAGENEGGQWPIRKGKIDGEKITFEVEVTETVYKIELLLIDDHLKGEATAERDGKTLKAKLDLKRKTD